jgi:hypothetical protein
MEAWRNLNIGYNNGGTRSKVAAQRFIDAQ